jgi:hypothetical protein
VSVVGKEPVLIQALAAIVVWLATRYGLHISDEQALQVAGGAFVVLAPFVRQLVVPSVKLAEPETDPKVFAEQVQAELRTLERVQGKTGPPVPAPPGVIAGEPQPRRPDPSRTTE